MRRVVKTLVAVAVVMGSVRSAGAQFEADVDPVANPWTHLDFRNDPDAFQFVIVTDHTGGHRPGVFKSAVKRVNLMQPEFVVCVGDLIEGYTEDMDRLVREWDEFEGFVADLEMPFFYVPGNHDITNQVMLDLWKKKFGRTYYSFTYRDVLFLMLDSEDPPNTNMSDAQIAFIEATLKKHSDVRWTLLFLHKPMWAYADKKDVWARVSKHLEGRNYTVFAGHRHRYLMYDENYYQLATTGGSSALQGPFAGQFDHVTWVTMMPDGPRMANLMLDGILPANVRDTYVANLTSPVYDGDAVLTGPVFSGDAAYRGGPTQIRLVNGGDIPMSFQARFEGHADLRPSVRSTELTVPAGETGTIPIQLGVDHTEQIGELDPLFLAWSVDYRPENRDPITIEGRNRIRVEQVNTLPMRKNKPKVDGRLDEWESLPLGGSHEELVYSSSAWQGAEDGSFTFQAAYDAEYLYIAVDARDDLVATGERSRWRNDALQIRVDARAEPDRSQGRDRDDQALRITMVPGEKFPAKEDADGLPKGIKGTVRKGATGYSAELAIPVSYVRERQGAAWDGVRLNIGMYDYDNDERRGALLWWKPAWNRGMTYAGSGTFLK